MIYISYHISLIVIIGYFLLQVEGISKGHLDKSLHAEAFKTLQKKKVKNTNEELQKLLETLDGFSLTEEQLGDKTNQ